MATRFRSNVHDIEDVRQALEKIDTWIARQGPQALTGMTPLTDYSPEWATSGSAPSLGNGTILGSYTTFLGMCLASIVWTPGSTTTFGTGTYSFTLPSLSASDVRVEGQARLYHSSPYSGICIVEAGADVIGLIGAPATGLVAATVPWTWTNGDSISATILYPI